MLMGKRIALRSMVTEDAWLLYRWFNDQRITADLGARAPIIGASIEEIAAKVQEALSSETELHLIIVTLAEGKSIGVVSLFEMDMRNGTAELRAIIGEPSLWDQGYGREAVAILLDHGFNVLNLHRVHLKAAEYNHRAIACFRSCGFEREGTLREDHYHQGGHRSSVIMSALRTERP
jgi:RimJ/RimL family protein N-acetyltransferase